MTNTVATSDIDLWSDENLANPYPAYAKLRDQAAVVKLAHSNVYALTRYDTIRNALGDWATFSSENAVGFNDGVNQALTGTTLATDPPQHTALRAALMENLTPLLREDPSLIPAALNKVLRCHALMIATGRSTTRDVEIDGAVIPAGSQIAISFGAGNHDPRHYENPDQFLIRRNPMDHLSFGYGVHGCAGKGLASLQIHAVFEALAQHNSPGLNGAASAGPLH